MLTCCAGAGRGAARRPVDPGKRPGRKARRRCFPRVLSRGRDRRTARCGRAAPAGIPIRRPASVWRLPAYPPQPVPVLQIRASYSKNLLLNHSPREGGSLWRGALYAHCAVGPTAFVRASWAHCHRRAAGSLKHGAFCFCTPFFSSFHRVMGLAD